MDIPNFKDILQKLSVFKNNLSLLIPVILAVVSVLIIVASYMLGGKVQARVQTESVSQWRQID